MNMCVRLPFALPKPAKFKTTIGSSWDLWTINNASQYAQLFNSFSSNHAKFKKIPGHFFHNLREPKL